MNADGNMMKQRGEMRLGYQGYWTISESREGVKMVSKPKYPRNVQHAASPTLTVAVRETVGKNSGPFQYSPSSIDK